MKHEKLLTEAFNKAKKEEGFTSKSHVTQFLSDYIQEDSGQPYGERILRIHHNKIIANKNETIELKQFAAESLINYLGYKTDNEFIKKETQTLKKINLNFYKKHRIKLLSVLVVFITILVVALFTFDNQRWMVWNKTHYTEVAFDLKKHDINQIKKYNETRIKYFEKINPDCNTVFFKDNNLENLWYGKNYNKTLDFFTSEGLHPQTGKTLKPITRYMIKKYICPDYN